MVTMLNGIKRHEIRYSREQVAVGKYSSCYFYVQNLATTGGNR